MGVVIIDYFQAFEHRKKQFGVTRCGQRYVTVTTPDRNALGHQYTSQGYRISLPFVSIQHPEFSSLIGDYSLVQGVSPCLEKRFPPAEKGLPR